MIIDFHTHVFPDRIAERAVSSMAAACGMLGPHIEASVDVLISELRRVDVDKAVALNIATSPQNMRAVNDFAQSLTAYDELIPFGSVHPAAPDALDELARIAEAGLKGVKFHPENQGFCVTEDRLIPIYEKISRLGLICVFHAGMDLRYRGCAYCSPEQFSAILPAFSSPVVLAHMGGYMLWEDVLKHLAGRDVYLDTAYTYGTMPRPLAAELVNVHGADKILLGSDSPWMGIGEHARMVALWGQNEEDTRKILGENARKLLCLE
ncbi:MAG: amidohydrolase family protein [Acidobacteriota bacterium]|jgi:predicted TIM-barrel fold metal-dependent hydrolase|nr:amidohydrolase family protein [Acidobacteriota bacterium]